MAVAWRYGQTSPSRSLARQRCTAYSTTKVRAVSNVAPSAVPFAAKTGRAPCVKSAWLRHRRADL
eukprot:4481584-Pyramimonas_sp.AAC.1